MMRLLNAAIFLAGAMASAQALAHERTPAEDLDEAQQICSLYRAWGDAGAPGGARGYESDFGEPCDKINAKIAKAKAEAEAAAKKAHDESEAKERAEDLEFVKKQAEGK